MREMSVAGGVARLLEATVSAREASGFGSIEYDFSADKLEHVLHELREDVRLNGVSAIGAQGQILQV
jgi:hypothetical protein